MAIDPASTRAALRVLLGASTDPAPLLRHRLRTFLTLTEPPTALSATSPGGADLYVAATGPVASEAFQARASVPHRVHDVEAHAFFRFLLERHTGYDGVVVDPEGPEGPFFLSFRTLYGFFLGFGMVRDRLVVHDGRHVAIALDQNGPGLGPWQVERDGQGWVGVAHGVRVRVTVDPAANTVDIDPVAAADDARDALARLAAGGEGRLAMRAVMLLDAAVWAIRRHGDRVSRASLCTPESAMRLRTRPDEYRIGDLEALLERARGVARPPG